LVREVKFSYLRAYDLQIAFVCFASLLLGVLAVSIANLRSMVISRVFGLLAIVCLLFIFVSGLALRFPNNFGLAYDFFDSELKDWRVVACGILVAFLMTAGLFITTSSKHGKFERITNAMAAAALHISCSVILLRGTLKWISL
jgi:hypothetical protein